MTDETARDLIKALEAHTYAMDRLARALLVCGELAGLQHPTNNKE